MPGTIYMCKNIIYAWNYLYMCRNIYLCVKYLYMPGTIYICVELFIYVFIYLYCRIPIIIQNTIC